jgi:hypothetical protein
MVGTRKDLDELESYTNSSDFQGIKSLLFEQNFVFFSL